VEEEFRLPPVVEFMADEADEVLNRVKIEPSVAELDDISKDDPFYVDGEEGGSD
jgi:DNA-directed RNA polymerase subunit H (RpoH/RPB5)